MVISVKYKSEIYLTGVPPPSLLAPPPPPPSSQPPTSNAGYPWQQQQPSMPGNNLC